MDPDIPSELYDFAHSHALSAAARTQWAPGRYGRLDWQGLFQSAITRIEPTAKQGKVLHPSVRSRFLYSCALPSLSDSH
jgi:DNA (cytosine-5)-methyltransferase 1